MAKRRAAIELTLRCRFEGMSAMGQRAFLLENGNELGNFAIDPRVSAHLCVEISLAKFDEEHGPVHNIHCCSCANKTGGTV